MKGKLGQRIVAGIFSALIVIGSSKPEGRTSAEAFQCFMCA